MEVIAYESIGHAAIRWLVPKKYQKGTDMSYRETVEFLGRHTQVIELADGRGARVAVCPAWQGRVMASSCGLPSMGDANVAANGPEAPSFGFVNRRFIEAGQGDPRFNNYGGEDRFWLSPEGGPFSLWFQPGAEQTLENWFTPPALHEGAWEVVSRPGDPDCVMATRMQFPNASGGQFELDVARRVRLLGAEGVRGLLSQPAVDALSGGRLKMVAFETVNEITNQGASWAKQTGLVSIWIPGMFCAGPETVVIVPYRPGDEAQLGPVVKSDYFGQIPPERLKVTPRAVLFAADGRYRSKIGTSQRRARNRLGSIDFAGSVLTVVQFTMPDDPTRHDYLNNMWEVPQAEPYLGDVANSYNDGPLSSGEQLGAFYEIESLSPAVALQTGESLLHRHRTMHLQADLETLSKLSQEILGVELETVRKEMSTD